jgi:predicted Zn finger-like uncharacterized protein/prepilin-type processing-associated H-X9-DG protein
MRRMSQTIQCPHCGQTYALTAEQGPQYSGQTITCTRCKNSFTVPTLSAEQSAAPPTMPPPQMPQQPGGPQPPGAAQQIPYGGYGQYQRQESNGLAVASLVCGIVGLLIPIVPGIIAVVLGIVALNRTKDPRVGGKGLAIAGISVGGASMLFSLCTLSVLLPSLNRARETANRVHCAANMRQIGQALLLYGNDNLGQYPPTLDLALTTQDISAEVFCCPSSNESVAPGATVQQQAASLTPGKHLSYVYVPGGTTSSSTERVVLYEPLTNHDQDGTNILYGDGHVSWESKAAAQKIIADVQAGKNPR